MDATLLDVTCCVHLHTLSSCCYALLGVVAQSLKSLKLLARECWVRLHAAVDFSILLAQRFWRETVSLLDVMSPRSNQWEHAQPRPQGAFPKPGKSALGTRLEHALLGKISSDRRRDRAFSHDVTAAILVFQNNEMVAMLVFKDNPVGHEPFSYVNTFICSNKFV